MVMVYGHLDSCILFYLRSTVQYVTFVTNQAEMGNRKEPSNQAMYWALKTSKNDHFFSSQVRPPYVCKKVSNISRYVGSALCEF